MNHRQSHTEPASRPRVLAVVLAYASFAGAWILLSDKLVQILFSEPEQIVLVSMVKGGVFVGVTSGLLYVLMRRWIGSDAVVKAASPADSTRSCLPFVLLAAVIIVFTGSGIFSTFEYKKNEAVGRLQTIAELKTLQITDWLRERQGDANFIQSNDYLADLYRHGQKSGDLHGGEQLQIKLEQLRRSWGLDAVMLLDTEGNVLWGSAQAPHTLAPPLQAAIKSAVLEHKVQRTGPYRGMAGHLRMDYVVPLTVVSGPAPLVILHIDLAGWLFPALQTWLIPSSSSETLLFKRDDGQVLFLNELRHQQDTAAKLRLPLATDKLLAAQVLRGEVSVGVPVEGLDYRGIAVIGVAHAVAGTDWFLVAKQDLSELYAEASGEVAWVGFVGLLALLIAGGSFYLLRQNQQLELVRAVQQSQSERLSALHLLAAIADSSDDAIFAKDLDGRYIQFNTAASRFVGKPVEAVLGHDDRVVFPAEQAERLLGIDRQIISENRIHSQEEVLDTSGGVRVFHTTKGPLRDPEGGVIGLFGIARDVTERQQAEAALRESESRFRALVEQSLAGIYIIQDDYFRYVNPGFAAIFGYEASEILIGRVPVTDLVSPEDRGRVAENVRRRIEGEVVEMQYTFAGLRRDGSRIDAEVHGRTFDYQGRPAVIGVILDITARKAAEEAQLRQAEELSLRNIELERFNRASIGREQDMIALKQQVNALSRQLDREPPYSLAFLDDPAEQTKQENK